MLKMDKKNTKSYLNDYKSEQARVLYASLPLASLINLTLGFILAVILHDIIEFHRIASWYAVIVAAVILRMMLYLWRKTSGQLTAESVKWIFLFRLGTAIIGCGWLLSLFLVFPSGNIPYQVLLAFVLGGMAAGAIASLGIDLISISLFAVPVVGGLSARFFFEDGDIPFSMSLMTFLFLIFTMLIARRTNRSIFENLILRIEKEKSEIDIRKNEARLNMAQSVSRTGSFDWDPVTGELFWSDQHYLLWGFSPGDVTPAYEVFISGIHPDDASYVKEVLQAALNGGEFYDCKHRVIHPDGKILYIHGRGKVTFDQTGKPLQMDGTVQDISDQVQAKKELENALERLRKTSSSVPGVVYEFKLDSQGNYSFPFSSDALDEVFEVRPEDLAKDSSLVFSKMHKDDLPVVMESIQKSAERITPWQHEFRIVKKDGSVRWLYGN
ncbi:MAG: PAS domain-containing protein, partial [Spirochaetia bacterium]|nr:PAS domain-containing protein [Spirochaetia bacterium]